MAGIPPPPVDIIGILRNPTLFNKPLYGNSTPAGCDGDNDLDTFCRAMGWTNICGVLPKKPDKKSRQSWQPEDYLNGVHKDITKTNISKEMSSCVLKGIQTKRDLKIPSERGAHRQRKVRSERMICYSEYKE